MSLFFFFFIRKNMASTSEKFFRVACVKIIRSHQNIFITARVIREPKVIVQVFMSLEKVQNFFDRIKRFSILK